MNYKGFLSPKADKQYKKLDKNVQNKVKAHLVELELNPHNGHFLSGKYSGLRYIKFSYQRVDYRIVFEIFEKAKEILIMFLGTRENFYKELTRYLG